MYPDSGSTPIAFYPLDFSEIVPGSNPVEIVMGQAVRIVVLTSISMSLGWRIRGQFGHEAGAAIAGVLGALSLVLVSGRADWWRRATLVALLGGLGWAFGGSLSYMKLVSYCHSSDPSTVLYGFSGLFLIGFLWAACGGAGTALPLMLDEEDLRSIFPPLACLFVAWFFQDIAEDLFVTATDRSLDWHDSDWLSATVALVVGAGYRFWRGKNEFGSTLLLTLSAGWWMGMAMLVGLLGLQLNPPRGDDWAGCVGLVYALFFLLGRLGLREVSAVALKTGFLGAGGVVFGQMLKLGLVATGWKLEPGSVQGGWHSIMEWTHGLFFGLALAFASLPLLRRAPRLDDGGLAWWNKPFAVFTLLWTLPYLNFRQSPTRWLENVQKLPTAPWGVPLVSSFLPSRGYIGWVEGIFLVHGVVLAWLLVKHSRRPLHIIPADPLGAAQLLFLSFTWAFTFFSLAHVVPEMRLVEFLVQVGITLQAILCTAIMLDFSERELFTSPQPPATRRIPTNLSRIAAAGLLFAVFMSCAGLVWKRTLFGDSFAGGWRMDHIRFGPNNTNHER